MALQPEPASVVLAHDYLTQRGGAERVAEQVAVVLGAERIVTSVYSSAQTFEGFTGFQVEESFLSRFPPFRKDPRRALPLLPLAWASMRRVHAGLVFCSSSGWSHGLRVGPSTPKVVYCHNPARWLYQPDDYMKDMSPLIRRAMLLLRPILVQWDRRAARSATLYLANSTSVAERIRSVYGIEPVVLFPPVSVDTGGSREPYPDLEDDFFLSVGRPRGYKGVDTLVEAFRRMPEKRLVVVGADSLDDLPSNVTSVGRVNEARLRWLYANAEALISVSREDFGLTPLEANSFGTPALVLRAGGFLDSTAEGVSGLFIPDSSVDSIVEAVTTFPDGWDRGAIISHAQGFSTDAFAERLRRILSGMAN